eukprot:16655_1
MSTTHSNRSSLGAMVNKVMIEMNTYDSNHSNESTTPIPQTPEEVEPQQITPLNSNRERHAIEISEPEISKPEISEPEILHPVVTNTQMSETDYIDNMNGYHINQHNVSTIGTNPGNLSARSHQKELIDDILTRCKIALTFLFHDKSPLHTQYRVQTPFMDRII